MIAGVIGGMTSLETIDLPEAAKQVGARPVNREGEPCPHILDRKGKVMEEWPPELRVREFPAGNSTAPR